MVAAVVGHALSSPISDEDSLAKTGGVTRKVVAAPANITQNVLLLIIVIRSS